MGSSTSKTSKVVVLGSERHLGSQISAYFREKRGPSGVSGLNTKSVERAASPTKILIGRKKKPLWTTNDHLVCALGAELRPRDSDFEHHEQVAGSARFIVKILKDNPPKTVTLLSCAELYRPIDGGLIDESTPVDEVDPWCLGQLHLEKEIAAACLEAKVPLLICRLGKFFGPGDVDPIFGPALFVRQAMARKPIELQARATEKDDYTWIGDICLILELLIFSGATGLINIASGTSVSYLDIAKEVCDVAAARGMGPKILVPDNTFATQISGATPNLRFNIAKLLNVLGPFQFTPVSKGIREYFIWLGIPTR